MPVTMERSFENIKDVLDTAIGYLIRPQNEKSIDYVLIDNLSSSLTEILNIISLTLDKTNKEEHSQTYILYETKAFLTLSTAFILELCARCIYKMIKLKKTATKSNYNIIAIVSILQILDKTNCKFVSYIGDISMDREYYEFHQKTILSSTSNIPIELQPLLYKLINSLSCDRSLAQPLNWSQEYHTLIVSIVCIDLRIFVDLLPENFNEKDNKYKLDTGVLCLNVIEDYFKQLNKEALNCKEYPLGLTASQFQSITRNIHELIDALMSFFVGRFLYYKNSEDITIIDNEIMIKIFNLINCYLIFFDTDNNKLSSWFPIFFTIITNLDEIQSLANPHLYIKFDVGSITEQCNLLSYKLDKDMDQSSSSMFITNISLMISRYLDAGDLVIYVNSYSTESKLVNYEENKSRRINNSLSNDMSAFQVLCLSRNKIVTSLRRSFICMNISENHFCNCMICPKILQIETSLT